MKILITGFEPFGGEAVNPSQFVAQAIESDAALAQSIGAEVICSILPVSFARASAAISDLLSQHRPDVVIMMGQKGGASEIHVERLAVNIWDAQKGDADGARPSEVTPHPQAELAMAASVPVSLMAQQICQLGIPAVVSNSAGLYVCNCVFYEALLSARRLNLQSQVGFFHLPYLPAQVIDKPKKPSMSLADMTAAISLVVRQLGSCSPLSLQA